jgi:hypothetical protein
MKITLLLLALSFLNFETSSAQSNQDFGINFQAIARNNDGSVLSNKKITVRLSIVEGSVSGVISYQEIKSVNTNVVGLFTIVLGANELNRIVVIGSFDKLDWTLGNKYLQIEVDPNNSIVFTLLGIQKINYVPYAIHAISTEAINIKGIVPIEKGGTGVSQMKDFKVTLGIDNVNNTSDLNKPISILQQIALDSKMMYFDTSFLYGKINSKLSAIDTISISNRVNLKENESNKSLNIIADASSNIMYPSVKAIKAYVDSLIVNDTDYPIPITNGGTGANSPLGARNNLGLVIGTDILAHRTFGSAANSNIADFEPAIASGLNTQYLRGDKTWQTLNFEPTLSSGLNTQYLRGDKTWQTLNSDIIAEGLKLFFTNNRARASISLTNNGTSGIATYDTATGIFNVPNYNLTGLGGEVPLTFSNGLTRLSNTITVNTTQNILKLSNLSQNGFIKASGSDGTLIVDNNTYLLDRTFGSAANSNIADFEPAIASGLNTQYLRGDKTWQTLNFEPTLSSGLNTQYLRGDKTWQTLNSDIITEGTKLFFTNNKARASISLTNNGTSGIATYDTATGIFNVPNYNLTGLGGEVPLTFSNGLTRSSNTITVNTTQNILKLFNLSQNGFIKASGSDGTLIVDNNTYLLDRTFGSAANSNIADFEPAIASGLNTQYLRGDKTWQILNFEPTLASGLTTQYLRGDKTWQTLNSDIIAEGLKLFFTNNRARTSISLTNNGTSGIATYDTATGIFNVPNYNLTGLGGEVPLTFSNGLTRLSNTITVNTTQNILKLSNLSQNGFIKASGSDGTLIVDNNTYLTTNESITMSGDVLGSGTNSITTSIGDGKVTNAMLAGSIDLTTKVSNILPLSNGGTGSSSKNFVDLSSNQSINGKKTFDTITLNLISKIGGTANHFLKADGSIDSNTYGTYFDTIHMQRNILRNASTGVLTFGGLTLNVALTAINIGAVTGIIVDNTTSPNNPIINYVSYAGATGIVDPYVLTSDMTYVLLNISGNIIYQTTIPTTQQRRENIYLGKLTHTERDGFYVNAYTQADIVFSPASQLRDIWDPIHLINGGVYPSANGVNLNINISAGTIYGLGVGWSTNPLSPSALPIAAKTAPTFKYRTRNGGVSAYVNLIDPTRYDLNGVVTLVGTTTRATNQRIFLLQNGEIRVQYGQVYYTSLANAIAGIQTESFITFTNFKDNGILIGVLSVRQNATDLSNSTQAKFFLVSKFGELVGASSGVTTGTLQQAYNNSDIPQIITNTTNEAVTLQRGSTADTDKVLDIKNGSAVSKFSVTGEGTVAANTLTFGEKQMKINFVACTASGSIEAQSGSGVSMAHTVGTGTYTISFVESNFTLPPIVTVSLKSLGLIKTTAISNTITVNTYDISGIATDLDFNLIAIFYK